MTEKHFEVQFDCWKYFHVVDTINERCIARLDTKLDADAFLEIVKEYEELVQENEELKCLLNACKEGQQNLIKDGKKCNDALNKIWDILKEEIKGETDD